LLTTLLLCRSGFSIGRYISLESKISENKDLYYRALSLSQTGWHTGQEDPLPFSRFLLGTILAAYKDFEDCGPS
jgi:Fic family protein